MAVHKGENRTGPDGKGVDGAGVDRRGFFRSLGGASALAATAVASPLLATEAQAYDSGTDERRARYRESEDVKAFYRTNGYETLKK